MPGRADPPKEYQWKKGQSGNPKGRPVGSVSPIKEIRRRFAENPETFQQWLDDYLADPQNRKHAIEMLDGKPTQKGEVEVSFPATLIELIRGTTNPRTDKPVSAEDTK